MTKLKQGDVIEIIPGHNINITNTHSIITVFEHNVEFIGKYVVTHTTFDGGGTGHGRHDTYPDGHHVWCQKLDDPDMKIDFYQSGSFISMIESIDVIGTARQEWILND